MGPLTAVIAVMGVYTSMLWLTARRLKQATEDFLRREAEIDRREAEILEKMRDSARQGEF